jgi:phosphinothricin acetyltransferase
MAQDSNVIVRPAVPGDAAAVAAVQGHYVRNTMATFTSSEKTPDAWRQDILDGLPVLVAERAGTVVGFASFGPFRKGPGYAHAAEHSLYLAPDEQGRGAGRALMLALEAAAAGAGISVLVAGISGANPGAVAFHRRMGFAETGRMPGLGRKQGQELDLVLMQKKLPHSGDPD